MDVQIKRGVIELLVLALLKEKDYYAYLLMDEILSFLDLSDCALYPILKRLESEGCLESYTLQYDGRLRKYYTITQMGIKKLEDAKKDWISLKKIYKKILGEKIDE